MSGEFEAKALDSLTIYLPGNVLSRNADFLLWGCQGTWP
jgi:hypothetical protein